MNDVKLPVLWIDQWGPFANAFRDDCMDASLAMVFHYLNIAGNLTVDDIANLLPPVGGLSVEDGAKIAAWFGVDARVETLTSDSIYAHLDAGRVIIPLLLSTDISERQDRGVFQHFWCIIGHTADGSVYVHDPDRLYGTTYGAGLIIPMAEMLKSIADATDVTGKHSQGLVIYGQFPVSIDHVAVVKSAGTRVRSAPGLNASIFEGLPLSTQVNVLAEAPTPAGSQADGTYHLWYRCQAPFKGTHIYGWIAGDLLAPLSTPEQPVYMYTTTRLNLRSAMALDPANVITVMPTNTRVKVAPGSPGVPGGIPWVSVTTDSGQVGYCSKAYLGPNPITPLPNPPAGNGVKVGLHFLSGPNTNQFLSAADTLAKAGKPLVSATIVNDAGTAQRLKVLSPSTFIVYRLEVGNPTSRDYKTGDSRLTLLDSCPSGMDVYQFQNEWGDAPDYYRGLMDAANQRGVKVTVGDWAVGTSPMQFDPPTIAMLNQCAHDGHYVNYHAYSSNKNPQGDHDLTFESEWFVMRWLAIAKQFPALNFVFGESGTFNANYLGSTQTLVLASQLNDMLKGYGNVRGANFWTYGGQFSGWTRSSLDGALPDLVQWLLLQ